MRRSRRRGERGQTLAIVAISATVLLGVTALAVDLGLQTSDRRSLQNVTDSAALAAANDLTTPVPTQANRITAATTALNVIHNQMQWASWGSWASSTVSSNCSGSGSVCQFTVTAPAPEANFTLTVNTPPKAPDVYAGQVNYVEVQAHETQTDGFTGVWGFGSSKVGARSVAFHYAGNQGFGFALYANTTAQSGNSVEVVSGNVYAGQTIDPQSSGKAGICADNGGSLVFGSPQYGDGSPYGTNQSGVKPTTAQSVTHRDDCSNMTGSDGGFIYQTASIGGCPTAVQGVDLSQTGSFNSQLKACEVTPPIQPPVLEGPTLCWSAALASDGTCPVSNPPVNPGTVGGTYQPGQYTANGMNKAALTVNSPLASGLYDIVHSSKCLPPACYDLTINQTLNNCSGTGTSGYTTCLVGVTFVLENGATANVTSGVNVYQTPYAGPTNSDGTASRNPSDGRMPMYAASGSATTVMVDKNGTTYTTFGTIYMPNGTFKVDTNAFLSLTGQAIVDTWNVQSGNHPNPDVTYNPNWVAPQREILRLAE